MAMDEDLQMDSHFSPVANGRSASSGRGRAVRRTSQSPTRKSTSLGPTSLRSFMESEREQLQLQLELLRVRKTSLLQTFDLARKEELEAREVVNLRRRKREVVINRCSVVVKSFLQRIIMKRRLALLLKAQEQEEVQQDQLLPLRLEEQLVDLKHVMHDLHFTAEDRFAAAAKIQARFRGIFTRKTLKVFRMLQAMWALRDRMHAAAVVLQAHTRARATFNALPTDLQQKLRLGYFLKRLSITEPDLQAHVTVIQMTFRNRVQRKRSLHQVFAQAVKQVEEEKRQEIEQQQEVVQVEELGYTWGSSGMSWLKRENGLQKLQEAAPPGLVPFQWSPNSLVTRHKIGGTQALQLQQRLGLPSGSVKMWAEGTKGTRSKELNLPQDPAEPLGAVWDLYPKGFRTGFYEELTGANTAFTCHYGEQLQLDDVGLPKKRRAKKRRGPSQSEIPPLPAHAEYRANVRLSVIQAMHHFDRAADAEGTEDVHPLLTHAQFLPQKFLPKAPDASAGRRPRRKVSQEGSWAAALDFYGRGLVKKGEDDVVDFVPLHERLMAQRKLGTPLALEY